MMGSPGRTEFKEEREDLNYQSFEEKYTPPVGEYLKGFYGAVAGFFRLPTTIRKFKEGQLLYKKLKNDSLISTGAMSGGMGTGLFIDLALASQFNSSEELFYTWLSTNMLSGIYEIRRYFKNEGNSLENTAQGGSG